MAILHANRECHFVLSNLTWIFTLPASVSLATYRRLRGRAMLRRKFLGSISMPRCPAANRAHVLPHFVKNISSFELFTKCSF